jgi:hypothetical protein
MHGGVCCENMEAGGSMQRPEGQPAAGSYFTQSGLSCCQSTIVGGLNHNAATLENQATPTYHKVVIAIISPVIPAGQLQEVYSTLYTLQQHSPPAPPSTELYLSNAALLI